MLQTRKSRLLLVAMLLVVIFIVTRAASYEAPVPERSFAARELLIDLSNMPPDWTQTEKGSVPLGGEGHIVSDSARIIFGADGYSPHKPTQQYIYRYIRLSIAKRAYEEDAGLAGEAPLAWTYQSAVADQSLFTCYDYEGREPYPVCNWVGRYEEFVVIVDSWLITERISLQDIEQIIRVIDARMAEYMAKPTLDN